MNYNKVWNISEKQSEADDCFVAQNVIDQRMNLQSDKIPTAARNQTWRRKQERINHLFGEWHCQENVLHGSVYPQKLHFMHQRTFEVIVAVGKKNKSAKLRTTKIIDSFVIVF